MTEKYTEIIPIKYHELRSPSLVSNVLTDGLKFEDYEIFYKNELFIGHLAYTKNKKLGICNFRRRYYVVKSSFSENRLFFLKIAFSSLSMYKEYNPNIMIIESFCLEIDKLNSDLDLNKLIDIAFHFAKNLNHDTYKYGFISLFKSADNACMLLRKQLYNGHRFYTPRKVNVILVEELSNICGTEILHPEQMLLYFKRSKSIHNFYDFGSFCYTKREVTPAKNMPTESNESHATMVDLSSYSNIRSEVVRGLIDLLVSSQLRVTSYGSKFRDYKSCFDFIDRTYETDPLNNLILTEEAYSIFTKELERKLISGKIKSSTGSAKQNAFLGIIETIYPDDVGAIEAKYVKIKESHDKETNPESRIKVKNYFNHILEHALKLHKQIANQKFPPVVKMNNGSIITYTINGCVRIASSEITYGPKSCPVGVIYDNYTGEVRDLDSIINEEKEKNKKNQIGSRIITRKKQYKKFLRELDLFLNDKYESKRYIEIINRLVAYYAVIFIGLTGANSSDIESWDYLQSLDVAKDPINKELIQVKFRAEGRVTKYPIGGNKGLKILNNYLALRKDLAEVAVNDKLFVFILNKNTLTNISKFQERLPDLDGTSDRTYKALMGDLQNVSLRQLRKNKSVLLHSLNIDSRFVADLLNHTQHTNHKFYLEDNIDDRVKSFSDFWEAVKSGRQGISDVAKSNKEDEKLVSGHCRDKGEPIPINVEVPFKVDCKEEYGCLYCKNFVCHLDEEDIHKLLSLRYVIKIVKSFATDYLHAEDIFRFSLLRIESILKEIRTYKKFKPKLDEYINLVDDLGILTPYWERKLTRYEAMGLYI
ncbi:hypothetical protein ACCI29_003882 [Vibrio parahaemolyticus]|nr:hypothetical protein [Vibrio parahaemolyticus]